MVSAKGPIQEEKSTEIETGLGHSFKPSIDEKFDDDGRPKRTGTVWTASAHIITAVIGAGVLSLAWCMAQLGWIIGITTLLVFAAITLYTANLLADCYRSPNPVTGKRNYTYMEAVKTNLGGKMYLLCGIVLYCNLAGIAIGYTITTSTSLVKISKLNCFHNNGEAASCRFSNNPSMIALGVVEIFLSQIPSFANLEWLSILAAVMSFGYAGIGVILSVATIIQGKARSTSLFGGKAGQSSEDQAWNMLVALGNIALASSFSPILIDIQDTLKSVPSENKTMRKANTIGLFTMTIIFLLCGGFGYLAFGSETPGNLLVGSVGSGWLLELANIFIVVHLVGAYQVIIQPVYRVVEVLASQKWPKSDFVAREYPVNIGRMKFSINMLRLVWRTTFVVVATILAMAMPFFNDMLALIGAIGFWPLVVYFPVEMSIANKKTQKRSMRWFGLKALSLVCLLMSLAAACAAIHGLNQALGKYKPFMYKE